jgi:anaerobic magnesium-protoporphyrin IX monomethyl ester cyclase
MVNVSALADDEAAEEDRLRFLVVRAPQVLSYFNAGHHLALYQVALHLRKAYPAATVETLDAPVRATGWKDMADLLFNGRFHAVAIMNDLDGIDGLGRFVHYARQLSPESRLVTFGRLSGMNPLFFRRYDLDAIVETGDFECSVSAAIDHVLIRRSAASGVQVRVDGRWADATGPGSVLDPDEWPLPDHSEIPYEAYDSLYSQDSRKFPGLPNQRELVVPVARGCPVGCAYCEVPRLFGRRERRLSVTRVVEYIRRSFRDAQFDYISFYAPTFTLNRRWVIELCETLVSLDREYRWKCCTTIHHLDENLVQAMGASGCVRISVGLETLEDPHYDGLPKVKRQSRERLAALAAWCRRARIELNCFVVVGLPGTSLAGTRATIDAATRLGARIRPTVYTPYEFMTPDMTEEEVSALNRQTFVSGFQPFEPDEIEGAYRLVYNRALERSGAAGGVAPRAAQQ